ncbi:uncharacterized protein [Palaemon carinicauda]|uniref:uncharacterized protein n=1 Tax=Palaemon carinicauda TaxID=392227 RepID=UPI0035B57F04
MSEKGILQEALGGSPGFYSLHFPVRKAFGGWRTIIDLSALNRLVVQTTFRMEPADTVRQAITPQDFMCTLYLKDAYLQIPMNLSSKKYLRFKVNHKHYSFRVLVPVFPQLLRSSQ